MHNGSLTLGGEGTYSTLLPLLPVNTARSSLTSVIAPRVSSEVQPGGSSPLSSRSFGFAIHQVPLKWTLLRTPQCPPMLKA